MNHDVNIADFVVHLHPDSSHDDSVSVHFDHEKQPHALVVAYNPDAVTSETVLAEIRKHDSKAVMAGF